MHGIVRGGSRSQLRFRHGSQFLRHLFKYLLQMLKGVVYRCVFGGAAVIRRHEVLETTERLVFDSENRILLF